MIFSKRKGYAPLSDTLQKEGMDDALRNGLWNALYLCIWEKSEYSSYHENFKSSNLYYLFEHYWHNLFKAPLDNLPSYLSEAHNRVRDHYFNCSWYEVYDFIEFTAQNCPDYLRKEFTDFCNHVLENEKSTYRFVDNQLTDLTADEEIESIESAISVSGKYIGVTEHLKTALRFVSDRKSPNYRNSVKESISSVESLCKSISGDPKANLGTALKKIEENHKLHPAFKKAFSNLYGFTSDSNGIRHALLEESTITYSDAKFMLVSCSAFVNYILGKLSEKS